MEGLVRYIYTLEHPITGVIVYVGACIDPPIRLRCHINNPSVALRDWMKDLKRQRLIPVMKIVDTGDNEVERAWIQKMYDEGHPLLNKNGILQNSIVYGQLVELNRVNPVETQSNHASPETLLTWGKYRRREDARDIAEKIGKSHQYAMNALRFGVCYKSEYDLICAMYDAREVEAQDLPRILQENINALLDQVIPTRDCAGCNQPKRPWDFTRSNAGHCAVCMVDGTYAKWKVARSNHYSKENGYRFQKKYNEAHKEENREYQKQYHKTYKHKDPAKRKLQRQKSYLKKRLKDMSNELNELKKSA